MSDFVVQNPHHERTKRFTQLHVIRMFLELKYYPHTHFIIPEALLECNIIIEETLFQDLKNIDTIATSSDLNEITKYLKGEKSS